MSANTMSRLPPFMQIKAGYMEEVSCYLMFLVMYIVILFSVDNKSSTKAK